MQRSRSSTDTSFRKPVVKLIESITLATVDAWVLADGAVERD